MFYRNMVLNSRRFIIFMFLCNKHGFVNSANETVCSEQSSRRPYDGSCNQSSQCISNSSDIMCVCPVNTHYNNYTASCVLDCNATTINPSGQIVSPNYPNLYPNSNLCTWTLTGALNTYYVFSISDMDIENSHDCSFDSLKIYDGTRATQLATFCDSVQTTRNMVASTTNSIHIVFKTDGSVKGNGFNGVYGIFDYNSIITEPQYGYIASPGYPLQYPANSSFSWTIRGRPGSFISLSISDIDIENSPSCTNDSLKIYDGPDGTQLATFCNRSHTTINVVASTLNSIYIVFKTNGNVGGKGFSGTYRILDYNTTITDPPNGYIASPGYPLQYPANSYFSWTILGRPGSFISLSISGMDIENSDNCTYDSLKIFDGTSGTQLATFCNQDQTTLNVVASTTNSMLIVFKTDDSVEGRGLSGAYRIHDYNSTITEPPNGYIASPGYPLQYTANSYFSWTILGRPGSFICFSIRNLTLEPAVSCSYDYVQVYDGNNSDARILNQMCSNKDNQRVFMSTGFSLYVVFRSDSSIEQPGFLASYEINECQTTLTEASGEIVSPGYPLNYMENLNCNWIIRTDQDKRISLRIKEMYLNDHRDCTFDYLRIYDGEELNYITLGTFCYLQSSYIIVSTSNVLTLVLETDERLNYKGFSATYSTSDVGTEIVDTILCNPADQRECWSAQYFNCLPDKQGVFRCLCPPGMYSDGTYCLPDSQLSVVLNSPPQILTKYVRFNWISLTDTQRVSYNITWVATEDSSDRGEMVAIPSGVRVQGLTPGTEYDFTVLSTLQGNDYYNDSVFPTHLTLETMPAAPGKLNESSSILNNIPYVLRFEPSEGRVEQYNITVGGKSYEEINPVLTIQNLTADTQYNYTITAYNKNGVGSDDVTGSFKTGPVKVTAERESLNVPLVAGVTAASCVVLIGSAVIVTLVIRQRRRNRKPTNITDNGDHDIVISRPPLAAAIGAKTLKSGFMDTNMAEVGPDDNIGEVYQGDYISMADSPADSWRDDTSEYLEPTNDADYLDVQDDESIYDNNIFWTRPYSYSCHGFETKQSRYTNSD